MEYKITSVAPEKHKTDCLVLSVNNKGELGAGAGKINAASMDHIKKILKQGDLKNQLGQSLVIYSVPGIAAKRVLLVHQGKNEKLNTQEFCKLVRTIISELSPTSAQNALLLLAEDITVKDKSLTWKIRRLVEESENHCYRYVETYGKRNKPPACNLKRISLNVNDRNDIADAKDAASMGLAVAKGVTLARELGNLPGNICTPVYLSKYTKSLAKKYPKLKTEIIEEKDMRNLGMGALLSVSTGSAEPAKLIVVSYQGMDKQKKPEVLIGKGITFDSGGISLKPSSALDLMKFDMCGAAAVIGTLLSVVEMDLALNVIGIIPCAENLPGGKACKPGDVVTSMSGQTIEILDTDAEGRLVLCDALYYAKRYKPAHVIDIATLTGASIVALGPHASALYSNDQQLADALLEAGSDVNDRAWQMPLWEEYREPLKSNFADIANVGGKAAGSITAASFLSQFVDNYAWAHLDMACTSCIPEGEHKGSTGRPTSLLCQYLINRSNEKT